MLGFGGHLVAIPYAMGPWSIWIMDLGFQVLIFDFGFWIIDFGFPVLVFGFWGS